MPLKSQHGRRRVVIEDVNPQIDGGRHAIHRIAGDEVSVTAAIYADGKDELAARLLYRHSSDAQWRFVPMHTTGNDLWSGAFRVDKLGAWRFTLLGWVDHFASWAGDLKKRIAAQGNSSQGDSSQGNSSLTDPSLADRILSDAAGDATASAATAPDSGAGLDIGSNPAGAGHCAGT
jgi:starch synthase (maltosyl-transferring)